MEEIDFDGPRLCITVLFRSENVGPAAVGLTTLREPFLVVGGFEFVRWQICREHSAIKGQRAALL